MDIFKERLKERTLDVLDWVDYRPDPHIWQYLAAPVALACAWFFTPMNLGPFLVMATVGVTVLALIVWLAGLLLCVAWRAIRDVLRAMLEKRRQSYPSRGRLVERFN